MSIQFLDLKKDLPTLGVGLGLRREVAQQTFENASRIDWLEFIAENYMDGGGAARERLQRASSMLPVVSHGVNLSLGSTDDINKKYTTRLKRLVDMYDTPWWSDHLCFTSVGAVYLHELLPLPFSREAANHAAERARIMQEMIGKPFLVENITYYMKVPGSDMTEAQFLAEVLEKADCGLMLDINNVYVNSLNHKFDPYEFLDQIPLERTVQIHVAGHTHVPEVNAVMDTHGAPVAKPVFELLAHVLRKTDVKAILLERDQSFPEHFAEVLNELDEIRAVIRQTRPEMLENVRNNVRLNEKGGASRAAWRESDKARGTEHARIVSS